MINKTQPTVSFTVDYKEMDTCIFTVVFIIIIIIIEQTPSYRKGLMTLIVDCCWLTRHTEAADAPTSLEFSGTFQTERRTASSGTCRMRRGPLE